MNNGTEYVLRFGNLTNVGNSDQTKDETKADETAAGEKKSDKDVHRYLFVMARFNENAVKRPELETLPELPPGTSEAAPATEPAAPASESAAPAAESSPPATKEAAPAATEAKKDDGTTGGDDPAANPDPPTEETPADAAAAPKAETAADAEKPAAESTPPAADANGAAPAAEAKPVDEATKQQELEKLIAERKRIELENQRKLDEYQAKLKKGQETVKDLNVRFGDWYFVVDDGVFRKIRLSRENVVEEERGKAGCCRRRPGASPFGLPGGAIPGLPPAPGPGR